MKLCISCRFFGEGENFKKCLRTENIEPVEGKKEYQWCATERRNRETMKPESCGSEAKYFEPLPEHELEPT